MENTDVYKRQDKSCRPLLSAPLNLPEGGHIVPVSYTHLDVYKRQVVWDAVREVIFKVFVALLFRIEVERHRELSAVNQANLSLIHI